MKNCFTNVDDLSACLNELVRSLHSSGLLVQLLLFIFINVIVSSLVSELHAQGNFIAVCPIEKEGSDQKKCSDYEEPEKLCKFVCLFFGRSYSSLILFLDLLTFNTILKIIFKRSN